MKYVSCFPMWVGLIFLQWLASGIEGRCTDHGPDGQNRHEYTGWHHIYCLNNMVSVRPDLHELFDTFEIGIDFNVDIFIYLRMKYFWQDIAGRQSYYQLFRGTNTFIRVSLQCRWYRPQWPAFENSLGWTIFTMCAPQLPPSRHTSHSQTLYFKWLLTEIWHQPQWWWRLGGTASGAFDCLRLYPGPGERTWKRCNGGVP